MSLQRENSRVKRPAPVAGIDGMLVARRQGVMFGMVTPVRRSRNRSTEVWSNVSLAIQPPCGLASGLAA